MSVARLHLLGAAMVLTGCAGPLPELPAPVAASQAWSESDLPAAVSVDDRWWRAFSDPTLDEMMRQAAVADDVRISQARLGQALAGLRTARASLRPTVIAGSTISAQSIDRIEETQFQAVAELGWAIDLNGAMKARVNAAAAKADASVARVAAMRLLTRATAARLYIAWREGLARAAAEERAVASLAANERLVEIRALAGIVPELERVSLGAELSAAEARPASARQAAASARLGLETLLGISPGALRHMEAQLASVPVPSGHDLLSSPAAVLARRPDLQAAELDLVAENASLLAARRDFWPTISLGSLLGLTTFNSNATEAMTGPVGRFGVGLLAPLFSFGRLEAARDEQEARRLETALRYRQAVANALAEVEVALVATRETDARLASLASAVGTSRDRTNLVQARYRAGLSSYLEVLAALNAEARLESELISASADRARAYVALSSAMGLGAT